MFPLMFLSRQVFIILIGVISLGLISYMVAENGLERDD